MMRRRMRISDSVAFAAVLAAAPLAAQSTNQATPPPATTPTPTPTPAPAGDSVGPPQLRDFNLNGTVTQPAAPTPTPTPTPTPRATAPTSAPGTASPRATPAPVDAAPTPRQPSVAAPDSNPSPDAVTADLPPTAPVPLAPDVSLVPTPDPVAGAQPAVDAQGSAWWPWLAALLAVTLGAGYFWRRRQQRDGERYATDRAETGALVAAPPDAAPVLPRTAPTPPRQAPRAPAPAPAQPPAPAPAPPATPAPDGIFSSRLKPALAFELVPLRAETDTAEGAALTFDLIVINQGSAPARDVLIEATLINAGPQVDAEIGRFFQQPAGSGERLPLIAPMSRVSLRMRVTVSGANLAPLVVEGRKLLVPMVAINAAYRWSGGELKDSSSFLVGRGEAEGGKMAPFRLDLGARSWSGLGARLHSTGLQR